jgi:hypothetical protein
MCNDITPGMAAPPPTKEEKVEHWNKKLKDIRLQLIDVYPSTLSNAIAVTAPSLGQSKGRIIHPIDDFEPFHTTLARAVYFAYRLQKDMWLIKELHPRAQEKQREELEKHITQPGYG